MSIFLNAGDNAGGGGGGGGGAYEVLHEAAISAPVTEVVINSAALAGKTDFFIEFHDVYASNIQPVEMYISDDDGATWSASYIWKLARMQDDTNGIVHDSRHGQTPGFDAFSWVTKVGRAGSKESSYFRVDLSGMNRAELYQPRFWAEGRCGYGTQSYRYWATGQCNDWITANALKFVGNWQAGGRYRVLAPVYTV